MSKFLVYSQNVLAFLRIHNSRISIVPTTACSSTSASPVCCTSNVTSSEFHAVTLRQTQKQRRFTKVVNILFSLHIRKSITCLHTQADGKPEKIHKDSEHFFNLKRRRSIKHLQRQADRKTEKIHKGSEHVFS